MTLVRAELRNACRHKHLVVDFTPGITAIVGPMAAGKSTFLQLIRASMANDFRFKGKKEKCVSRTALPAEPSYVETSWATPSGLVSVRRGIRGSKSALTLDGNVEFDGKRYTKDTEITEKFLSLLGLSKAAVSDLLFADFKQLHSVVDAGEADRAAMFASMCGIEDIAVIHKAATQSLSSVSAQIGEFSQVELDSAHSDWVSLKMQRSDLLSDINSIDRELSVFGDDMDQQQLSDRYYEEIGKKQSSDQKKTQLRLEKDALRKAEARRQQLQTSLDSNQGKVEVMRHVLDSLEQTASRLADTPLGELAFGDIDSPLVEKGQPLVTALASFKAAKVDAMKNIRRQQYRLSHNQSTCDQCGTNLVIPPEQVSEEQQKINDLKEELDGVSGCLRLVAESYNLLRNKQSADIDRGKRQYNSITNKLAEDRFALANVVESIKTRTETIAELEQEIKKIKVITDKEFLKLRAQVKQQTELEARRKELLKQMRQLRESGTSISRRYRRLRENRRRVLRMEGWQQRVARIKDATHRGRLPSKVLNQVATPMVVAMNRYLEEMGVDFRVDLSLEDFSFLIHQSDGFVEPATDLSHGQTLALGVAFWISRARVFMRNLPIFFLDEPSANLDAQHQVEFADYLRKLAAKMQEDGDCGVIVTHAKEIAEGVTHLVEL